MTLKQVNIELSISQVQQVLAISLDDDAEKALEFIKENLLKQVQKALQRH
jgi:hypothetical protein